MRRFLLLLLVATSTTAVARPRLLEAEAWQPGRIRLANYSAAESQALDQMSREELMGEKKKLIDRTGTLVTPLVLTITGGSLFLAGAIMTGWGFSQRPDLTGDYTGALVGTVGFLIAITGAVFLIIGAVRLILYFVRSGTSRAKIQALDKRIESYGGPRPQDNPPPPPPPLEDDAPPAPPPPPPGPGAMALFEVATF